MVEMITGTLPWRSDDRERDREQVSVCPFTLHAHGCEVYTM